MKTALLVMALLICFGCGGDSGTPRCTPGATEGCLCADGRSGIATCSAGGGSYGPCVCTGCAPGQLACPDGCLGCSTGEVAHCGENGVSRCCPAASPVFCDDPAAATSCWRAGTDCSTAIPCGGATMACQSGSESYCDEGVGYCCDPGHAMFCGAGDAGDCAGCFEQGPYPGYYSCATAARCTTDWLCRVCAPGCALNRTSCSCVC